MSVFFSPGETVRFLSKKKRQNSPCSICDGIFQGPPLRA